LQQDFRGVVYLVNPNAEVVASVKTCPSILFGLEGLSIIYWYKIAAKNTLELTEKVLKFLYPH